MKSYIRKRASSRKRWSGREDRIILLMYPNYAEMQRSLRGRSYYAIRNRVRTLGVVSKRHVWTNSEVSKLQALYLRGAKRTEVAAAFPSLGLHQITSKARHLRLVRGRRKPYVLGIPPIDAVREQAAVQGWSWRKLDKLARTGRYFQQTTRRVDWNHLAKAIKALGGAIEIDWLLDDAA